MLRGLSMWWWTKRALVQEIDELRAAVAAEKTKAAGAALEAQALQRVVDAYGDGVAKLVAGFRLEAATDLTRLKALTGERP